MRSASTTERRYRHGVRAARSLIAVALAATLIAACGEDDGGTGSPSGSSSSTAVSTSTTAALTAFPEDNENLTHGGSTWAVVLAASTELEDPDLTAAVAAAKAAGYTTGPTDCDAGAPEALGLEKATGLYTVSVYFTSEADARQALKAFTERGTTGGAVAEVQTYCMD